MSRANHDIHMDSNTRVSSVFVSWKEPIALQAQQMMEAFISSGFMSRKAVGYQNMVNFSLCENIGLIVLESM